MTAEEFDAGDWIDRLARALGRLSEAQKPHRNMIDRMIGDDRAARESTGSAAFLDRADTLWMFFSGVLASNSADQRQHFRNLRGALEDVWNALREHPALKNIRAIGGEQEEFLVRLPNFYQSTRPMNLVSGVMARAENVPEDGYRLVGRELNALLDPDRKRGMPGEFGYLATGYHVALFHGLRFREAVAIADGMSIVPSGHVEAFVHERVSRGEGPEIVGSIAAKSSCAIVKPFDWTPEFLLHPPSGVLELDWGGAFREDAEAFVELLAVSHGSPAVCLLTAHYCIHRTAACLLGRPGFTGEQTWGRSTRSFDRLAHTREADIEAIDDARRIFEKRDCERYSGYEPAISRLAEALARSGQFAADDKVLDVAIALERIYKPDDRGISAQLQERVAGMLANSSEEQTGMKEAIKHFFDVRSAIIHGPKDEKKKRLLQERPEAFQAGFDLARRSVLKLANDGPCLTGQNRDRPA